MADIDLRCLNCLHGPHLKNTCTVCGCENFIRPDHQMAKAAIQINNFLVQEGTTLIRCVVDILAVLCEQFPEAEQRVITRREQLQKEKESQNNEQSTDTAPVTSASDTTDSTGESTRYTSTGKDPEAGPEVGSSSVDEGATGAAESDDCQRAE